MSHGRTRAEAIARMRRALEMTVIEGIQTSVPMHLKILADEDFQQARISTAFMERFLAPPQATATTSVTPPAA
jgi:acetyl-CoA carboxylase biotin carboxylase subunit